MDAAKTVEVPVGFKSVVKWVQLFANGTGPLACLILNIFEINYSQLIQYEILEKLVTYIYQ